MVKLDFKIRNWRVCLAGALPFELLGKMWYVTLLPLLPGDFHEGRKKINAADVVLSSCETHQGETSALVLCLKKEKKTIHTSLLPFFIWQGGGMGWRVRNLVVIAQLEPEKTGRGLKHEDRTMSSVYHFYSVMTIDQVRDVAFMLPDKELWKVFLEVSELKLVSGGKWYFSC